MVSELLGILCFDGSYDLSVLLLSMVVAAIMYDMVVLHAFV